MQQDSRSKLEEVLGSQDGQPVPLDVVHEIEPSLEEFGTQSVWGSYKPGSRQYDSSLRLHEVFPAAKESAVTEAEAYSINNEAKYNFIRRHGNCVGVVGIAGIGKTTFAKQYMSAVNESQHEDEGFRFFVSLRDFDFEKEINLLQFLLKSTLSNWSYQPEEDASLLKKLASSSSVHIAMDGLDEARMRSLPDLEPAMSLFDRAKPSVILKNLLAGRLLPDAKKMIISRPGAYQKLHPEYKPRFTVKVVGLSEDSQQLLCMRVCTDIQRASKLKARLTANPAAKALCFIPMFCKLITSYALRYDSTTDVLSIADVFTSFVLDVVKSTHFNGEIDDVLRLARLAYEGMVHDRFLFDVNDLNECGIAAENLETFINLQVSMSNSQVRVLDGEKRYFFSHLTWQEYFAALYMMFVMEEEEWKKMIGGVVGREDRWEIVLRFLFGFLNSKAERKLTMIFPKFSRSDVYTKRHDLLTLCAQMAEEYRSTADTDFPCDLTEPYSLEYMAALAKFKHRPVDTTLPKLCHFCHESKNDSVNDLVCDALPPTLLLSRRLLPSDVASFCHVMTACASPKSINVGYYTEPAMFGGKGLTMFLETMANSPHKVIYVLKHFALDYLT